MSTADRAAPVPARTVDAVVIGAGPVGSLAALAAARRGARVVLLEAAPQAAQKRLAGEWLHPPAVEALAECGITLHAPYATGEGFVVFPDDGTDPMVLPYADGTRGFAIEHGALVDRVRAAAAAHPDVLYIPGARVLGIDGQCVEYQRRGHGGTTRVCAGRIIGADGRSSVARAALGIETAREACSRMAGVLLEDVQMPFEGYGHVFLGGPGPILAYRIAQGGVRLALDVPLSVPMSADKNTWLYEAFAAVLPASLRPALRDALRRDDVVWAHNQVRPRMHFGRDGLVLIGDAVGHYHPLTALGMTLGFRDAVTLARSRHFDLWRLQRIRDTRVPEMLAVALYEVFADPSDETVAIRNAVYEMWRTSALERTRTMRYLAAQDQSLANFGSSFLKALGVVTRDLAADGVVRGDLSRLREVAGELRSRIRWLVKGVLYIGPPTGDAAARFGTALRASAPTAEVVTHQPPDRARRGAAARPDTARALERGARALGRHQREDGSWEGETVWCAMLAAQYALTCIITGTPISGARRARILRQFEATRGPHGLWGLHEHSEPYLFVTALVYVAARMLGAPADDPCLVPAREFIRSQGGVTGIPSWGKFWLAMLNLYEWRGVNPVLPEAWALPRWMPLHPRNYYCHTRLIYMAMASIGGRRWQMPLSPLHEELRSELYVEPYEEVDFDAARARLRAEEVVAPPGAALRGLYAASRVVDRWHVPRVRAAILSEMREAIRWELRTSDHTSISPVSGLLNIISLWIHDRRDRDLDRALTRLEGWIFDDETDGLRVTGARSATWDSAFAVQALAATATHVDVHGSLSHGLDFLRTQQIRRTFPRHDVHGRVDSKGGFCFAGVWHGWPVSDCTAEAVLAFLEAPGGVTARDRALVDDAVAFILRCQNPDGGFGSYEARKLRVGLEWMNPAEMFRSSMTESSYVECTASNVTALAAYREHFPEACRDGRVDRAVGRAVRRLRALQRTDGSWRGVWGIQFTYGTMFGIRGLRAAGVPPQDPALRRACRWLLDHQRADGGWGEHFTGCSTGQYTEHSESQVIQTAWALSALIVAEEPRFEALQRAGHFLASMQQEDGEWPRQDPAGIFFDTAVLDYTLYRRYFPMWALALFETRRKAREALIRGAEHADAMPAARVS